MFLSECEQIISYKDPKDPYVTLYNTAIILHFNSVQVVDINKILELPSNFK